MSLGALPAVGEPVIEQALARGLAHGATVRGEEYVVASLGGSTELLWCAIKEMTDLVLLTQLSEIQAEVDSGVSRTLLAELGHSIVNTTALALRLTWGALEAYGRRAGGGAGESVEPWRKQTVFLTGELLRGARERLRRQGPQRTATDVVRDAGEEVVEGLRALAQEGEETAGEHLGRAMACLLAVFMLASEWERRSGKADAPSPPSANLG
jgi:hypothetical protein